MYKSFYEYFKAYADDCGDKKFLFDEKTEYTVKEAFSACKAVANTLWNSGVRGGLRVGLCCTRTIETSIMYFALQFIGAITYMIDPHDSGKDMVSSGRIDMCVTCESGAWVLCDKAKIMPLSISKADGTLVFPAYADLYAPTTVIFTSGSTGKSKAVMLCQMNNIRVSTDTLALGWYLDGDIAMEILPICHVFGLSLIITAIIARYALFFPNRVEPKYLLECIEKYKVTRMNGVPTLYLAIANANKTEKRDVSTLRTGLIGGAPVTPEQFDFIENELGVTMIPVYGMSECIVISCASYKDERALRAQAVGRFYDMSEGSIVDENGNALSVGEEGEVCVKSPVVMVGYEGGGSENVIDGAGRLHTGDLGYVDSIGLLHITGRKKDIVIRNGVNISCAKIEKAVLALPYVAQAAVVGVEHSEFGEAPALFAVIEDKTVTEEGILRALSEVLAKNEIPQYVVIGDDLPLTSSGKPDKQKIKEIISKCKA